MKALFARLQERFANRPDSEHQQAFVRLAILGLVLVYLYGLWTFGSSHAEALRDVLVLVAVECAFGFAIIVSLVVDPGISPVRRVAGMLADYSMLGTAMYFMGEPLAPLYVVYVWTTIGSGLRYGGKFLVIAGTLACLSFGLVIFATPYWIENRTLALGLLVGLVAIPAYLSSLMNAVQRATIEAKRANEAKSRFLATMSHEFRTPLNGIVGVSDLLSTTTLSAEQQEYSEVIVTSAKALLTLVENVLDISAIEAGKLRRQTADFAVADVVNDVQKILSGAAAAKRLQFEVRVAQGVPERVVGDSDHLRQILINLTANAIKFTEIGRVSLIVTCARNDGDTSVPVHLQFSVIDTGIGIPAEAQPRVFQAFEQADQGHGRRYGGSGLGTSIAKALTDLADGTIGFESKPGEGSHFWVNIPFARSSTPVQPVKRRYPADRNVIAFDDPFLRHRLRVRSLRILIADDQAANRMVLQRLLQKGGHEVVSADGGEEVLNLFAEDVFDAVIIDLHMPDVSGLDVLKQARFMQSGHAPTPLIVLSADATPETIQACKLAGAYAFLSKPITNSILLDTLAGVAESVAVAEHAPGSGAQQSPLGIVGSSLKPGAPEISIVSEVLLEDLEEQFGADFLKLFVKECMRDAYRLIGKLEEAGSAAAWEDFRDGCHALKGVAGNIGAEQLVESAANTMKIGNVDLPAQWRRRTARLREQFQATRSAFVHRRALIEDRDDPVDQLI